MATLDKNWPAWFYGSDGASAVFASQAAVPAGWVNHPSKVGAAAPAPTPTPTPAPIDPGKSANPENVDATGEVVDAYGWPWDPTINSADKRQTQTGLWQLLPGKSRPAAKPGYPKPALDL